MEQVSVAMMIETRRLGPGRRPPPSGTASVPRRYPVIAPAPPHLQQVPPYMRNRPTTYTHLPSSSMHPAQGMPWMPMPGHSATAAWMMNEVGHFAEPWNSFPQHCHGVPPTAACHPYCRGGGMPDVYNIIHDRSSLCNDLLSHLEIPNADDLYNKFMMDVQACEQELRQLDASPITSDTGIDGLLQNIIPDIDNLGPDQDFISPAELDFLEQQTFGLSLEDMLQAYAMNISGNENQDTMASVIGASFRRNMTAGTSDHSTRDPEFHPVVNDNNDDDHQGHPRSSRFSTTSSKASAVTAAQARSPTESQFGDSALTPAAAIMATTQVSSTTGDIDRKEHKTKGNLSARAKSSGDKNPKPTEKKFQCPMCPKRFSRPSARVAHLRVHTGEKPYSCPKCERHFSIDSNMVRHCKTHDNPKPRKRKRRAQDDGGTKPQSN